MTDPGKAMLSGKWTDIGKTKGPMLRGLAGRAPYFAVGEIGAMTGLDQGRRLGMDWSAFARRSRSPRALHKSDSGLPNCGGRE
ncbi:MAG TPA: hypothetical protein VKM54_08920 [Myxococcota bacterium]|nr:hypothetical protein [Myxococcota bacterium]